MSSVLPDDRGGRFVPPFSIALPVIGRPRYFTGSPIAFLFEKNVASIGPASNGRVYPLSIYTFSFLRFF